MTRLRLAAALASALIAVLVVPQASAGPPPGFGLRTVAAGFTLPTSFAHTPAGDLLVAEKSGRVMAAGADGPEVALDLRADVNSDDDAGLLGMTADESGRVFLMYTRELFPARPDAVGSAEGVVVAYRLTPGSPPRLDPATRRVLVSGFDVSPLYHAGGALRTDTRGRLLVALGDGARWQDVDPRALRAQDLDDPAGKLLRIDPDTGLGVPDNPFFSPADPGSVRSRVVAYGLRNPFRIGVDPETDAVYIADVGWNAWEEVNVLTPDTGVSARDRNFGWPCYEGGTGGSLRQPGYATDPRTSARCAEVLSLADGGTGPGATPPVLAIPHGQGNVSLTGGPVYRAAAYPGTYRGAVFLADYARDEMLLFRPATGSEPFGSRGGWGNPVDIQVSPAGRVTYASISTGTIREIVSTPGNRPPVARAEAGPRRGPVPLEVVLDSEASTDPDGDPLKVRWDPGDGSRPRAGAVITHTYTRPGSFTATVSVGDPAGASDSAFVVVDVANTRPVVEVTGLPDLFRVGDSLPYAVVASDAEDGGIPDPRLTHRVVVHHLDHLHYGAERSGTAGTLDVDDHGDAVFYEIRATATDAVGGTTTVSRIVRPDERPLTVTSDPEGVEIVVDGTPRRTPDTRPAAIGSTRTVIAPTSIVRDGVTLPLLDGAGGVAADGRRTVTVGEDGAVVTLRYGPPAAPDGGGGPPAPAGEPDGGGGPTARPSVRG